MVNAMRLWKTWLACIGLGLLILAVVLRAGMTRGLVAQAAAMIGGERPRPITLRVWDWWSPSGNEEYGYYFEELEAAFERRHPQIDVVYQIVPFGYYVQKLSTAMVGRTPPDVFQSSVYWAEGFYQRGMLRPVNDLLAADAALRPPQRVSEEMFLPSAWRHNHTTDGVVYGIPQIIDAQCLLWNLDVLEAAAASDAEIRDLFARDADGAIDYGRMRFDAISDWDHFRRICRKLTRRDEAGRIEQAGYAINTSSGGSGILAAWLATNGGRYQDAGGRQAMFHKTGGAEALTMLAELYWHDRVCPPFRRQISDSALFGQGKVAAVVAGTWSGKDIMRNTLGWTHFAKTAFPPGPSGDGPRTVTWGNMLVITKRCRQVEAAWKYIRFVCSLEGNLLRLKHLRYNGPRLDFYDTAEWQAAMQQRPYLSNVKQICLVGEKLRHTEIIAVDHQANPILETVLLRYPDIAAGRGPYPSVQAALDEAAANVNNVYRRYHEQVARWARDKGKGAGPRG